MANQNQQDFFRRLDRALARRYVHEYMLGRERDRRLRITPPTGRQTPRLWQPRMEMCDDPQSSRISATLEVPGLKQEDLTVERQGDKLIVSGERRSPIPSDPTLASARYPVQEFKYGKYRRVIDLPPGTLRSTVSCLLRDGLFVVTWPRTPVVPAVPAVERPRIEPQRSSSPE
jgi:HSP20 family protein